MGEHATPYALFGPRKRGGGGRSMQSDAAPIFDRCAIFDHRPNGWTAGQTVTVRRPGPVVQNGPHTTWPLVERLNLTADQVAQFDRQSKGSI